MTQTQKSTANNLEELYMDARLLGQDTDPIVGLVHKHYFLRDLQRRSYECSRYGVKVAVVLINITNLATAFEEKNQLAGELDRIGTMLDDNLRLTDLATWYGPSQFAIQMPHAEKSEAETVCKRLVVELKKQLGFKAEMKCKVRELNDMHTADLLLGQLKESQFRKPPSEQASLFSPEAR